MQVALATGGPYSCCGSRGTSYAHQSCGLQQAHNAGRAGHGRPVLVLRQPRHQVRGCLRARRGAQLHLVLQALRTHFAVPAQIWPLLFRKTISKI